MHKTMNTISESGMSPAKTISCPDIFTALSESDIVSANTAITKTKAHTYSVKRKSDSVFAYYYKYLTASTTANDLNYTFECLQRAPCLTTSASAFPHLQKNDTCYIDVLQPVIPNAAMSVSVSNMNNFNPAKHDSINKFFSQHLIPWVSVEPTICTFAHHLHESLSCRLDLHILEPNSIFSFASKKRIPSVTVVRATLSDLVTCATSQFQRDTILSQNSIVHDNLNNLMISNHSYRIFGIDYYIDEAITISFPYNVQNAIQHALCQFDTLHKLRGLQTFLIFCATNGSPDDLDISMFTKHISAKMKNWSISCQVLHCPLHGDPLDANRILSRSPQ